MAIPKEKEPGRVARNNVKVHLKYEKGRKAPDNLEWHKIVKGESLETIANDYGWRLEDLFIYNWITSDTEEVNWYLRNYVGCLNHDGKSYIFNGLENPGMILVPKLVGSALKGPPRTMVVPRNGKATLDSHLQVIVMETLAYANYQKVSGKWLYVFSGAGVDFGYKEEEQPKLRGNREAGADGQPGSAFPLDFPGVYHLEKKPDRVDFEIYVTSDKAPDPDTIKAVSGSTDIGKTDLKFDNSWYFLSDRTVLDKATKDSRHSRVNYVFRGFKTVSIDLTPNGQHRRYYFLLSPVKLGPKAIKYAMNNPNGLTPLLKHNVNTIVTDPKQALQAFDENVLKQNLGPVPADIKQNPVTLVVIDPYAWAENIANHVLLNNLKEYADWIKSDGKRDETTKDLTAKTGWTLDHLYVAKLLKSVKDSHPKNIEKELEDPGKWLQNLDLWHKELEDKHAAILSNANRSLMQLILWLNGQAHKIIETAILEDTDPDNPMDATDVAIGIIHWGICSEQMFSLEPGIDYLNKTFNQSGSVAYDFLLKYLNNLGKNSPAFNIKPSLKISWRLASKDVLLVKALRDFVSLKPPVEFKSDKKKFQAELREYFEKERDNLIKLLNDNQIFPGLVQAVPLPSLNDLSGWDSSAILTTMVTTLDLIDKGVSIITTNKKDFISNTVKLEKSYKLESDWLLKERASSLETFAKKHNRLFWSATGVSWSFKGAAVGFSIYNLINVFTSSRYDYQTNKIIGDSSLADKVNAVSTFALAAQDTLIGIAELAAHLKGSETWLSRAFPSLVELKTGGRFVPIAQRSLWGKTFATINVFASIVCGVTTIISMQESMQNSIKRGDVTAAQYYAVGRLGGLMMAMGGATYGASLIAAGAGASATGVGATIGIVLIFIGGVIALIATIFGKRNTSDDYQLFARRCFLGKEGKKTPRFGDDPEDWTHAPTSGDWTIEQQKRALHNLLGRFTLQTSLPQHPSYDQNKGIFKGDIIFTITPGLIMPGTTVQIELFYYRERKIEFTTVTSATLKWSGPMANQKLSGHKLLEFSKGNLFDAEKTNAYFAFDNEAVNSIIIWIKDVNYQHERLRELLTDVTIRYPDSKLNNVIRTRKLIMYFNTSSNAENSIKTLEVDKQEVTSGLFE